MEAAVPKNLQYFNKPPQTGKSTPAHQDGFYFMLEPCVALTLWMPLDHVDEENGCVRYGRGSHKAGLREHERTQTLGFSQGINYYPTEEELQNEVACPASPGDLLFHDALTIHRAGSNLSLNRTRRALGFIYYSALAEENVEAHRAYQSKLAQQLKDTGEI